MQNRAFLFILATLLIDAIGIGIVFPIMPDLMDRVGAGSTAEGSVWAGLMMSAYAGMMFLCGPAVGSLSDAIGRKPVLLAALALLAIDYVIMALAGTFWLLLVGRLVAGMAGSTYITATAFIADISSPEDKAARFGMIGAAFGIGFVIGPALGGIAATWHITAPFWIAAMLAGLNVLFGIFVLPESLPSEKRRKMVKRDINPFTAIFAAFRMPGLAIPLVCLFTFEFANMVYPTLWAFWTREVFGWGTALIGMSLAIYGVMLAGVQGGLMPVLIKRFGEMTVLWMGLTSAVVGMIGFGFTNTLFGLGLFLVLAALSDLTPPLMTAMSSNMVDEQRQGMLQGVIASLSSVAAIVAPLIMTGVFGWFSGPNAAVYFPGAPFILSAVLILAIVPLVLRMSRQAAFTLD
ncbi:MFS transporter, DHA1 family, tetracycline resistance protein [Cognatiyoonia koreensis]|uniref:MFS transporter, DHA1 family, tetracycline resistance protein n=1 Tax=Cognatiyoonia koreensis TaxID=364200 RepID=A0A1I0Q3N3_9RHOB|nr:MFS transporter [Cognatiyoonia koreensis]SEW21483.1 MFS transporter, DHA1 family, tetracycline resistance protein [Cognatiyoonia koreensis]